MWKRLCKAIGREDLLADAGVQGDNKSRAKNRVELNGALNQSFKRRPAPSGSTC